MARDSPAFVGILEHALGALVDDDTFMPATIDGDDSPLHDLLSRARVLGHQLHGIEEFVQVARPRRRGRGERLWLVLLPGELAIADAGALVRLVVTGTEQHQANPA